MYRPYKNNNKKKQVDLRLRVNANQMRVYMSGGTNAKKPESLMLDQNGYYVISGHRQRGNTTQIKQTLSDLHIQTIASSDDAHRPQSWNLETGLKSMLQHDIVITIVPGENISKPNEKKNQKMRKED
jgi:hypothetical protein